jgi:hypothetical protein
MMQEKLTPSIREARAAVRCGPLIVIRESVYRFRPFSMIMGKAQNASVAPATSDRDHNNQTIGAWNPDQFLYWIQPFSHWHSQTRHRSRRVDLSYNTVLYT